MKCSFLMGSASLGHLSSPGEPEARAVFSCKGLCSSVKGHLHILEEGIWGRWGCFLLGHGLWSWTNLGSDSGPHKLDVRQGDHHKTQSPHI